MLRARKFLLKTSLIVLAGTAVTLTGCSNKESSNTEKTNLKILVSAEIPQLDSAKSYDTVSDSQIFNFQEGLYKLGKKDNVVPAIAKSKPEVSQNGLTYTVKLKNNAKWSNGDSVTAQDFVFAWQRAVDPKTKSQNATKLFTVANAEAINDGKKPLSELGAKALNQKTLQIKLAVANPYFLRELTGTNYFPQNEKFVRKVGKKYGTAAKYVLANGPFIIRGWKGSNDDWSFVKNPYYYDAKQIKLHKVNVSVVTNPATQAQTFEQKTVDITPISGEYISQYSGKSSYHRISSYNTSNVEIDNTSSTQPALNNVNFRRALFYAVNRKSLTSKVLKDGSVPAIGYLAPGALRNPKTGKDVNQELGTLTYYDKGLAQKYLAKAKQELNTEKFTLSLKGNDTDAGKRTTEYLQGTLQSTLPGVTVNVQNIPTKSLFASLMSYNFELDTGGWEAEADPSVLLQQFTTGYAHDHGGFSDNKYDQLVSNAQGKDASDEQQRYEDLKNAQKILLDNAVVIPLYHSAANLLINPQLRGVQTHSFGQTYDFSRAYFK
ncbi:peptide ABC transporter substrate-binding protein [Lacticaseibacillus paracasei]|uniref:peptide ABC transporter substrate-binding protein n=1 Tax=Lacticaseibacillus paracasei TaxID=1597 RepID=UPI00403F6FE9